MRLTPDLHKITHQVTAGSTDGQSDSLHIHHPGRLYRAALSAIHVEWKSQLTDSPDKLST